MTTIKFPVNVEICGVKIPKGEYVLKREWVGLTDEERDQAEECCWYMDEFDPTIYAENIEAKLKEKNT